MYIYKCIYIHIYIYIHYCRSCGDIYCHKCSTLKLLLTLPGEDYEKGPVRVCDYCAIHLSAGDNNSMLRYCNILNNTMTGNHVVTKLQAARALHISIEHLSVSSLAMSHRSKQYESINELSRQMGGASKLWGCVLPLLARVNPSELRELGCKLIESLIQRWDEAEVYTYV
jgi:hypothetical protein